MDSVTAISKYGLSHNILMMINPPPGKHYADYFAIKLYTQSKFAKYLIIFGELGGADGSEGMYKYMMENLEWKLEKKIIICEQKTFFDEIIKELYFFKKIY